MKRNIGINSRMSNYQYPEKTAWKWTPAKIAAFSIFGLMTASLIYFESTSTKNSFNDPLVEKPTTTVESTSFDKDYQEFLKRGTKIVSQETLDSLKEIETNSAHSGIVSGNVTIDDNPAKPETLKSNDRTAPAKSSSLNKDIINQGTPSRVENNLEVVELSPASKKTSRNNLDRSSLGTLEEANPPDDVSGNFRPSQSENSNEAITEEFYTEEVITGRVVAASNGAPIQGVSIKVKGTDRNVISDGNGIYSINVPADPEHRTIQYLFRGNVMERDVSPGKSVINVRF